MTENEKIQLNWSDFCPACEHYDKNVGVCSAIHENIASNPGKFNKKCNSKLFVENEMLKQEDLGKGKGLQNLEIAGKTIYIQKQDDCYSVNLPDHCVLCEAPGEKTMMLKMEEHNSMWSDKKGTELKIKVNGKQRINKIPIPYCQKHYDESKKNEIILLSAGFGIPTLILIQ